MTIFSPIIDSIIFETLSNAQKEVGVYQTFKIDAKINVINCVIFVLG